MCPVMGQKNPVYNLAPPSFFDIHFNIIYPSKSTCPRGLFRGHLVWTFEHFFAYYTHSPSHLITTKHFMNLVSRSNNNEQAVQRPNKLSTILNRIAPVTVHFKCYIIARCSEWHLIQPDGFKGERITNSETQQPYIKVHRAVTLCGVTNCCHEGRCMSVERLRSRDHG